jgi:hypothetical protein
MKITRYNRYQKRIIKKEVIKALDKYFNNTELDIEEVISSDYKKWIYSYIDDFIPNDSQDLANLGDLLIESSKIFNYSNLKIGSGQDKGCKLFIDALIDILFKMTQNKGMGSQLYRHFNNLWSFLETINEMFSLDDTKTSDRLKMENLLTSYEQLYEYTTHHLVEFTLVIAENSSDTISKNYVKSYYYAKKQNKNLMRGDLLNYCRHLKIFNSNTQNCSYITDGWIRNGKAHAKYRIDSEKPIIYIGKRTLSLREFKKSFINLYNFNAYIISKYMKKSNISKNTKKFVKKTTLTSQKTQESAAGDPYRKSGPRP